MCSSPLLKIEDLVVSIEEKDILKGLNLEINQGEVHVIMGPNGAGKSTLGNVLMGHPQYQINSGSINFEGQIINDIPVDERAKKGIFLSFQYPEEISGVTVENFLRTAKMAISEKFISIMEFQKELKEKMDLLKIPHDYKDRYLNLGFSGGEKKKNEILQMSILDPKLAILDETDSGLDVDAVKIIYEGIKNFSDGKKSFLVITHYNKILDYLNPDYVHILVDGKIVTTGDVKLAQDIEKMGYENFKKQLGQ
ncbi:FeS assembly ATPase SufC [Gottschalkia purinilytica]|uniref:FeS assembly ATPase SufC n=1 Tax=Gottschalkia purinilytica TaxID=1503 RepID=A0A0L0WAS6_GOTPU|nr:Fe-S cluster assembly ATPase SufC [Gottschalkia purinilytica]KNF08619.1 FeS assembly ATPase SufC [Gottschalkia purinilytica]